MTQSTSSVARPRRSCLYMPGTNSRAHDKARTLDADVLIFDLEDSVAPDSKVLARELVVARLVQNNYGTKECVVRVNSLATPWGADDFSAVAKLADAVLLPKVTGAGDVRAAGKILDGVGSKAQLWAMMETARGILVAPEIAAENPRLSLLAMGLEDFAKELHADSSPPRTAMLYALERTVLVARAYGLGVLDGVYPTFDDEPGFDAACAQGATLGFDGKQLIHPRQISAANAAYAPSADAVSEARRLIAAFEDARAQGEGIAVLGGTMIEALHVARARDLISFAEAVATRSK
jgi:citrate lyase subunit beta/citryl-CoA lyase